MTILLIAAGCGGAILILQGYKLVTQDLPSDKIIGNPFYIQPWFCAGKNPEFSIDRLPAHLIILLLLREDSSFYRHSGFNRKEIVRSLKSIPWFLTGKRFGGGSSITEQLVGFNLHRHPVLKRTKLSKRVLKFCIGLLVERFFSKDQILVRYLNSVPFMYRQYGIGRVSYRLFKKSPEALSVAESDFLISLLPAGRYFQRRFKSQGATGFNYALAYEKILGMRRVLKILQSMRNQQSSSSLTYEEVRSDLYSLNLETVAVGGEQELICDTAEDLEQIRKIVEEFKETFLPERRPKTNILNFVSGWPRVIVLTMSEYVGMDSRQENLSQSLSRMSEETRRLCYDSLQRHNINFLISLEAEEMLPQDLVIGAKALKLALVERQSTQRKFLLKLGESFEKEKIRWLLFKGIDLENILYHGQFCRPAGDVDILISSSEYTRCAAQLFELGLSPKYAPENSRVTAHAVSSFDGLVWSDETKQVVLDVHLLKDEEFSALFARSRVEPVSPMEVGTCYHGLDNESYFVFLVMHASKHLFSRLNLVLDIYLLAEKIGRKRVLELAIEHSENFNRLHCLIALYLCDSFFLTSYTQDSRIPVRVARRLGMLHRFFFYRWFGDGKAYTGRLYNRCIRAFFLMDAQMTLRAIFTSIFSPTLRDYSESGYAFARRMIRLLSLEEVYSGNSTRR